jgi:putative spermidine/putrescine transport system substrate-binding protein
VGIFHKEERMDRFFRQTRISRRRFLGTAAALGALGATGSLVAGCGDDDDEPEAGEQPAGGNGRLVIGGWGGRFTDSTRRFLAEPFTEETGIEIEIVDAPGEQTARLFAQRDAGRIEWDLVDALDPGGAYVAFNEGLAARLPDDLKSELEGILNVVNDWSFAYSSLAHIFACNVDLVDACPSTPEEYWDTDNFPGLRMMSSFNSLEVITMAMLADGVPRDEIFPVDLDRAFAKLEEIKPHVAVWFTSGDQIEQVLRDEEVELAWSWSGRMYNVADQGVNLDFNWNSGVYEPGFWFAVEGGPNPEGAWQFLEWFAKNAEAQAQWATEMQYSPANPDAFDHMDEEVAVRLADYPENFEQLVVPDWQWYADHFDEIERRWNEFIAG